MISESENENDAFLPVNSLLVLKDNEEDIINNIEWLRLKDTGLMQFEFQYKDTKDNNTLKLIVINMDEKCKKCLNDNFGNISKKMLTNAFIQESANNYFSNENFSIEKNKDYTITTFTITDEETLKNFCQEYMKKKMTLAEKVFNYGTQIAQGTKNFLNPNFINNNDVEQQNDFENNISNNSKNNEHQEHTETEGEYEEPTKEYPKVFKAEKIERQGENTNSQKFIEPHSQGSPYKRMKLASEGEEGGEEDNNEQLFKVNVSNINKENDDNNDVDNELNELTSSLNKPSMQQQINNPLQSNEWEEQQGEPQGEEEQQFEEGGGEEPQGEDIIMPEPNESLPPDEKQQEIYLKIKKQIDTFENAIKNVLTNDNNFKEGYNIYYNYNTKQMLCKIDEAIIENYIKKDQLIEDLKNINKVYQENINSMLKNKKLYGYIFTDKQYPLLADVLVRDDKDINEKYIQYLNKKLEKKTLGLDDTLSALYFCSNCPDEILSKEKKQFLIKQCIDDNSSFPSNNIIINPCAYIDSLNLKPHYETYIDASYLNDEKIKNAFLYKFQELLSDNITEDTKEEAKTLFKHMVNYIKSCFEEDEYTQGLINYTQSLYNDAIQFVSKVLQETNLVNDDIDNEFYKFYMKAEIGDSFTLNETNEKKNDIINQFNNIKKIFVLKDNKYDYDTIKNKIQQQIQQIQNFINSVYETNNEELICFVYCLFGGFSPQLFDDKKLPDDSFKIFYSIYFHSDARKHIIEKITDDKVVLEFLKKYFSDSNNSNPPHYHKLSEVIDIILSFYEKCSDEQYKEACFSYLTELFENNTFDLYKLSKKDQRIKKIVKEHPELIIGNDINDNVDFFYYVKKLIDSYDEKQSIIDEVFKTNDNNLCLFLLKDKNIIEQANEGLLTNKINQLLKHQKIQNLMNKHDYEEIITKISKKLKNKTNKDTFVQSLEAQFTCNYVTPCKIDEIMNQKPSLVTRIENMKNNYNDFVSFLSEENIQEDAIEQGTCFFNKQIYDVFYKHFEENKSNEGVKQNLIEAMFKALNNTNVLPLLIPTNKEQKETVTYIINGPYSQDLRINNIDTLKDLCAVGVVDKQQFLISIAHLYSNATQEKKPEYLQLFKTFFSTSDHENKDDLFLRVKQYLEKCNDNVQNVVNDILKEIDKDNSKYQTEIDKIKILGHCLGIFTQAGCDILKQNIKNKITNIKDFINNQQYLKLEDTKKNTKEQKLAELKLEFLTTFNDVLDFQENDINNKITQIKKQDKTILNLKKQLFKTIINIKDLFKNNTFEQLEKWCIYFIKLKTDFDKQIININNKNNSQAQNIENVKNNFINRANDKIKNEIKKLETISQKNIPNNKVTSIINAAKNDANKRIYNTSLYINNINKHKDESVSDFYNRIDYKFNKGLDDMSKDFKKYENQLNNAYKNQKEQDVIDKSKAVNEAIGSHVKLDYKAYENKNNQHQKKNDKIQSNRQDRMLSKIELKDTKFFDNKPQAAVFSAASGLGIAGTALAIAINPFFALALIPAVCVWGKQVVDFFNRKENNEVNALKGQQEAYKQSFVEKKPKNKQEEENKNKLTHYDNVYINNAKSNTKNENSLNDSVDTNDNSIDDANLYNLKPEKINNTKPIFGNEKTKQRYI